MELNKGMVYKVANRFYTKKTDSIDKQIVQNAVKTVEQLGNEFDWKGAVKHFKVLELIKGKTGLSDDEIYNIIKDTVLEVNNVVQK